MFWVYSLGLHSVLRFTLTSFWACSSLHLGLVLPSLELRSGFVLHFTWALSFAWACFCSSLRLRFCFSLRLVLFTWDLFFVFRLGWIRFILHLSFVFYSLLELHIWFFIWDTFFILYLSFIFGSSLKFHFLFFTWVSFFILHLSFVFFVLLIFILRLDFPSKKRAVVYWDG